MNTSTVEPETLNAPIFHEATSLNPNRELFRHTRHQTSDCRMQGARTRASWTCRRKKEHSATCIPPRKPVRNMPLLSSTSSGGRGLGNLLLLPLFLPPLLLLPLLVLGRRVNGVEVRPKLRVVLLLLLLLLLYLPPLLLFQHLLPLDNLLDVDVVATRHRRQRPRGSHVNDCGCRLGSGGPVALARSSRRARPWPSSVPVGLRGAVTLGQGHGDAQTFVAKELSESSLPPPSSVSSVFAIDLRPHEGTKIRGYTNGNAPHTEKTSVFGPWVMVVVGGGGGCGWRRGEVVVVVLT